MTQATFNFAPRGKRADIAAARSGRPVRVPASQLRGGEAVDPGDVLGFDYARFGMVPPAPCLWPGHPIREGWERGRRLMARRTRPATLAVTRWLALRLAAWQRGESFDDHQITPQVLRSLEVATHCPITGHALGNDAVVVPVDVQRGWVAGNLMLASPAIAERWTAIDWAIAKDALARAEADPEVDVDGLPLRHWRRVVALKSLATPLPHDEAARIPLLVLPPNRLRLVNPIQELQAVLTLQLSVPGWGQRARTVADSLPQALRTEFNLFFNSLLAQALRKGHGDDRPEMRHALAAAWGNEVVMRRWGRFAARVDAELAGTLVERLTREPMPGLVVLRHGEAAVREKLAA
ncbi:MAG: hypothetical protein JF586_15370 [Burkholderiales bacterium]|jgi:hypothetical protein|nr:hypothetical protein [Burkholderiales bacterium]